MTGIEDINKIQLTPFMCWVLAFLFFLAAIVAYKVGVLDVALGCVGAAGVLVLTAQSLKQAESKAVKAIAVDNQAKIKESNEKLNELVDQLSQKTSCEKPPGVTDVRIENGRCEYEKPLAPMAGEIREAGTS